MSLHFRDWRGAVSLRYRNRAKITVLMCEQKSYPVWLSCGRKSHPAWCEQSPNHLACRLFSRGVIFTRAGVSLALLSLRKNGGLLVVYKISKTTTLLFQLCILHDYNVMSNFTPYRQHEHASTNFSSCF